MRIITRKRLNDFAEKQPDSKSGIQYWYKTIKRKDFKSFADLRESFPSADQVGKLTVFNIGGNKVRLVVAIHYNRRMVFIRAILNHQDYDLGKWKE